MPTMKQVESTVHLSVLLSHNKQIYSIVPFFWLLPENFTTFRKEFLLISFKFRFNWLVGQFLSL